MADRLSLAIKLVQVKEDLQFEACLIDRLRLTLSDAQETTENLLCWRVRTYD